MAARNPQTMAKRAREQAMREKRERKRAKKADAAAARVAAKDGTFEAGGEEAGLEVELDHADAAQS